MTKSLPELESENANFRAAKADAHAEVERLQDRRKTLLLTASVDEILKIDDEIRRQEITGEKAQAKADALRSDLYWARENAKRYAGVSMPSDDELERLLAIVTDAVDFPRLDSPSREILDEFRRAFYAVGRLGRLAEPDAGRDFVSSLDDANMILRSRHLSDVNGDVLLAACLAWGDLRWRGSDKNLGQMLECALAKPNTGTPARPVWREILARRADVLPPLPPRGMRSSAAYPTPNVKIYREGSDGQMRESEPLAPLWVN
jgi:hypothetical protein